MAPSVTMQTKGQCRATRSRRTPPRGDEPMRLVRLMPIVLGDVAVLERGEEVLEVAVVTDDRETAFLTSFAQPTGRSSREACEGAVGLGSRLSEPTSPDGSGGLDRAPSGAVSGPLVDAVGSPGSRLFATVLTKQTEPAR